MSTTAARRTAEVIENARRVVAIELLGAVQALRFRLEEDSSVVLGDGTCRALASAAAVLDALDEEKGCPTPSEQIECLAELLRNSELLIDLPELVLVGDAPEHER